MLKNRLSLTLVLCLIAGSITINAQDKLYADEFPLGDVTLLDGPLKKARDLNIETLLQYDCDRLLAPYRKEAGLEPRARTYPNWDGLDGHVGGH
ncbi:MAG: beta-L-arabinofuranosidase domain-containing protein, partial [Prevotella sp.]